MTDPPPMPYTLTWVHPGDVVQDANLQNIVETFFVMPSCEGRNKTLYCETCRTSIVNIGNLEMHLEKGGEHRLAIYCSTHHVFEMPTREEVDAFAQLVERQMELDA